MPKPPSLKSRKRGNAPAGVRPRTWTSMKLKNAIAIAALLLAGCTSGTEKAPDSPVLATVNGETITVAMFQDKVQLSNFGFSNLSASDSTDSDARIYMLSQMIEEEMYLQEAKKLGISASDSEVEAALKKARADYPEGVFESTLKQSGLDMDRFRDGLARRLTVDKLIAAQVYSGIKIDRARARAWFVRNREEFSSPAKVHARQIVVDNKADAEAILKEIKAGGDFAAIAKVRSFSPDGASGGDLGYFSKGEMPPEFDKVVFRLKPGQVSGVVKTDYGYHVFKVEDARPAKKPSFEEAEDDVVKRLTAQEGEKAFAKWQEALKARTAIEVRFEALGKL